MSVWFCGVVVITSASHAEGREFEPHQNLASICLHKSTNAKHCLSVIKILLHTILIIVNIVATCVLIWLKLLLHM